MMTKRAEAKRTVGEHGVWLETEILREANLGTRVQIVDRQGEIRLLPADEPDDWQQTLDDLVGCLGEERAEDYDFDLKKRYPYET
jgi:hypothetical protein